MKYLFLLNNSYVFNEDVEMFGKKKILVRIELHNCIIRIFVLNMLLI